MKKKKLILYSLKIFIFTFLVFSISQFCLYMYAYLTPKFDLYNNEIIMFDNKNVAFFDNTSGSKRVKLNDISNYLIDATIATEDKNFYKHKGFDYPRIIKALFVNLKHRSIMQGASTISQQYIKNMYLSFDQTWKRKIEEAFLTLELETHYKKDEILEGYLNKINYGAGNYGIENASNFYFNKKSKDLSLAEASLLAGIPKNPTLYNPLTNFNYSKHRQKIVLDSMLKEKLIDKKTYNNALKEKLSFYGQLDENLDYNINYYRDAVLAELNSIKSIPKSLIKSGNLKIYTNMDYDLQKNINHIIQEEMKNCNDLEVATLVTEPFSGKITALIGGKDYNKSEFNRAINAYRQVGSTFKPLLYYSALENGFTSSSTFSSEKTVFNMKNGKTYSPRNYGNRYPNKPISLASAIALSDNIYAVKTHLFLGEENLVKVAHRMGIKENLVANPSLALGTANLSMLDFANAYNTLANYGIKKELSFINRIEDYHGNILYKNNNNEELVLNQDYVYILNELLTNTYDYNYIDYSSPTMLPISNILTKKYAVKSGTTDSDYWIAGFNPNSLVLVWNGFDDNKDVLYKDSIVSKNIWAKSIEYINKDKDNKWYDIPYNINGALVDPISGNLTNNTKKDVLYYIKGTEPFKVDPFQIKKR